MALDRVRQTFWRDVWRRVVRPKRALDWAESVALVVVPVGLLWFALGREQAMEEVITTALYMTSAAVVAGNFLVLRLASAAADIHVENLASIASIEGKRAAAETEYDQRIKTLEASLVTTVVEEARPIRALIRVLQWGVERDERRRRCYRFGIEIINREDSAIIMEPSFAVQTPTGFCGPYSTAIKDFPDGLNTVRIEGRKNAYGTMVFSEFFNPVPDSLKGQVVYPPSPTPDIADGHIALLIQLTDVLSKKTATLSATKPYDVS